MARPRLPLVRWIRQHVRLPLRARAALGFGLTALLLGVTLAAFAYSLIRQQLVDERESAALQQTYANARVVRTALRTTSPDVPRLLAGLQLSPGGTAFLHRDGQWFASDVDSDRRDLPEELRRVAAEGHAAHQRIRIDGAPVIVIGVPITETQAEYFQVVPIADIDRTLSRLVSSLSLATALATAVAVIVGIATTGAVLRPLRRVNDVARQIGGGDLASRLSAEGDPELSTLVASFNAMVDELQARIEREARFASDVAHEVRGPLTALAAAVDVVDRRRAELPERAVLAVDALQEQVARFNGLVLNLLEISRFDAGAARLEVAPLDVAALVRAVLDELGCNGVPVTSSPPSSTVVSDERRLHQVFANLIENAKRYAGGPTAVTVDGDTDYVRIAVEDRGPGVPDEERQEIFARFARGSAATRAGGVGP
jgi:two-component system sensor histidine kinase MtrB